MGEQEVRAHYHSPPPIVSVPSIIHFRTRYH